MVKYKLGTPETFAQKIINSVETGEWVSTAENVEYLKWLAEGNTPEPAEQINADN